MKYYAYIIPDIHAFINSAYIIMPHEWDFPLLGGSNEISYDNISIRLPQYGISLTQRQQQRYHHSASNCPVDGDFPTRRQQQITLTQHLAMHLEDGKSPTRRQ